MEAYETYRISEYLNTQGDIGALLSHLDAGEGVVLNLHTLGLLGLQVHPDIAKPLVTAIPLTRLASLTLESCDGWGDLLQHISDTNNSFGQQDKVRLTKSCLRSEGTTQSAV